jgi:hypothetical protein
MIRPGKAFDGAGQDADRRQVRRLPEAILNPATGEPIARDAHGGVKQSGYGKDMSI